MTIVADAFVDFQFELSTAESEKQYFSVTMPADRSEPVPESHLPGGVYRVIDGELYLLVAELPSFR